ncbi:uncharacterized protein LOC133294730 [Gastrolobium bilobum]|uniref:uncharacterized protein LOC133294730 n=1 Tax=Gastrolobium bilobum TaxID=150636 RepID=UPI002AB2BFD6|nr:uncharacterized protein LOC133294730 [Gastrolobium bilobum]
MFHFHFTTSSFSLLLLLLFLFLFSYNSFTLFSIIHLPFTLFSNSQNKPLLLHSPQPSIISKWSSYHPTKLSPSVFLALKQENSPLFSSTSVPFNGKFSIVERHKSGLISMQSEVHSSMFQARVKAFFAGNSSSSSSSWSSCKVRFFMTLISPLKAFGHRELLSVESLFKSHPQACLVIVSKSLDSVRGTRILRPFLNNGFRVMAIAPDFNHIFKDTHAEAWFDRLNKGNVNPGGVSLGQNLSNLLRLALLYKFGGIYIDTDVIVLKSFSKLRNTIGAQSFDVKTGKWSRLNNAVLIFDKKHPLLLKFIEEFALTFDGNKWGHNGPYLVSRVVSRVSVSKPGFNFTIIPPSAFYPVDWRGIRSLFEGPRDVNQSKWLVMKHGEILKESLALHLWNRQSKKLKVEKGSIVDRVISSCCIFCNSWN